MSEHDDDQLATLSDEEFLNQSPDLVGSEPQEFTPVPEEEPEEDGRSDDEIETAPGTEAATEDPADTPDDADGEPGTAPEAAGTGESVPETAGEHTTPNQPDAEAEAQAGEAPNYEALYRQMMAPFKANGREFAPKSPEEAIRLMQMGANYTKKMQALAPNLKLMRMLENKGLLQEDKLAFLIDLDAKNPAAIQKLLHDGKVDPMDLDPEATPTYTPGNHAVSDAEMSLHDALDTVSQTPTGKQTIQLIQSSWDQASKQAVYHEPSLLEIIDSQRSNGIYDRIAGEIERRKILGEFNNVPFIQAYKAVGDALHQQGLLVPNGPAPAAQAPVTPVTQPRVVDTRPPRARVPAVSREQVRAVSAAPGSPAKAPKPFDVFAMSDAEIEALPTIP